MLSHDVIMNKIQKHKINLKIKKMIYPVPSFNSQRNKIGKPANILDEFRKRKKENKS